MNREDPLFMTSRTSYIDEEAPSGMQQAQHSPASSAGSDSRWLACLVVWAALNLLLLACQEDPLDWKIARKVDAVTVRAYQPLSISGKNGQILQARYLPARQTDTPAPLVVFLHGAGERGHDNMQQLQTLPTQLFRSPAFTGSVLAPQCPPGMFWGSCMPELETLIQRTIRDHRIDPQRIYLTGFSMGGYGSWELAARRPDLFAAVVPICGGGDTKWAPSLKEIPLWAVHGVEDQTIPPHRSREMIQALQSVGGTPHYTELSGIGHDSWHHAYDPRSGILAWMFQQRRIRPKIPGE